MHLMAWTALSDHVEAMRAGRWTVLPDATYQFEDFGVELRWAAASMRGNTGSSEVKPNQDAASCMVPLGPYASTAFFGIFDGHGDGGEKPAAYAAQRVSASLLLNPSPQSGPIMRALRLLSGSWLRHAPLIALASMVHPRYDGFHISCSLRLDSTTPSRHIGFAWPQTTRCHCRAGAGPALAVDDPDVEPVLRAARLLRHNEQRAAQPIRLQR